MKFLTTSKKNLTFILILYNFMGQSNNAWHFGGFTMILRRLISAFLIQAMFLTSANAYPPNNKTLFLMNEERELRCQITTEAAKLFSLEQLENLVQKNALAVKVGESQANELRPCNEDDAFYTEIVFSDPELAIAISLQHVDWDAIAFLGIFFIVIGIPTIGAVIVKLNESKGHHDQEPQSLEEAIKTICGERDALVTSDGVQCLDENSTVGSSQ